MSDRSSSRKPAAPRELHEKTAEAIAREKDRRVSEVGADDLQQAKEDVRRDAASPEENPPRKGSSSDS